MARRSDVQPLREYLERVCVLRDWGEVIVATNLVLEPLLQRVLYRTLSDLGNAHSDSVLPHFAYSIYGDEERHWQWGRALAKMVNQESEENTLTTVEWVEKWTPLATRSVEALALGVLHSSQGTRLRGRPDRGPDAVG